MMVISTNVHLLVILVIALYSIFFSLEIQARSQGSSFVSSATIKEIVITYFSFPFCIMLTITGQFGNAVFASTWKVGTNRCIFTFLIKS